MSSMKCVTFTVICCVCSCGVCAGCVFVTCTGSGTTGCCCRASHGTGPTDNPDTPQPKEPASEAHNGWIYSEKTCLLWWIVSVKPKTTWYSRVSGLRIKSIGSDCTTWQSVTWLWWWWMTLRSRPVGKLWHKRSAQLCLMAAKCSHILHLGCNFASLIAKLYHLHIPAVEIVQFSVTPWIHFWCDCDHQLFISHTAPSSAESV